jgi:high-affinity Fe2+/Pb2+ permease
MEILMSDMSERAKRILSAVWLFMAIMWGWLAIAWLAIGSYTHVVINSILAFVCAFLSGRYSANDKTKDK